MISRKTGFNTRKTSTAISASHNNMLASRRRRLEATLENRTARTSRELSVTLFYLVVASRSALFVRARSVRKTGAHFCRSCSDAERFAPLLDDFRHALG